MTSLSSHESEEEAILVRCAKAGDDDAFDQLYRRHRLTLCAYITKMTHSYEDALQLTQEAFTTAWQNLQNLQTDASFKSWLYGIATHQTLDWLRRRRHFEWLSWEEHTRKLELFDYLQSMRETPLDEQVIAREIGRLALQRVTDSYRACLLLQIEADLPQAEIAQLLRISPKSVSVFVKRALQQLQKAYEQIENEIKSDIEKRSK